MNCLIKITYVRPYVGIIPSYTRLSADKKSQNRGNDSMTVDGWGCTTYLTLLSRPRFSQLAFLSAREKGHRLKYIAT